MTCFTDHIGLMYCAGGVYTAPASGIYLNTLPGITIENIDKIASADQVTYLGIWRDVQAFALAQFRLDVMNEIKKCYDINPDCDYDAMICDNITELTTAWKYLLGVTLMIFRQTSDRINQWTTIKREEAKELQAFYQLKYEEALKQGVLLMDTEECCLTCAPSPNTVVWLP
jgi:hypothetical protein